MYWLKALGISLLVTLVGLTADALFNLEMSIGLDSLFKLRGVRSPSEQIVIVTLDEASEVELGLGADLTAWRKYHARLIQQLVQAHPMLIVFDLQFITPQPAEDPQLAAAMRSAGNVLLTECVQKFRSGTQDFFGREECAESHKKPPVTQEGPPGQALPEQLVAMRVVPPLPLLAEAALDRASFHLMKDAADTPIREAWLYFDGLAESPSLPLLIWTHFLNRTQQLPANLSYPRHWSDWLTEQRRACLLNSENFQLSYTIAAPLRERLRNLICGSDSRYLDFYGPTQTFRMISYVDVLQGKHNDLRDRIVLIGKVNRQFVSNTIDTFQTPFSDSRRGKISGVEIMATQLANLLENRAIHMPVLIGLSLLLYSMAITLVLTSLNGWFGILLSTSVSLLYAGYSWWLFSSDGLWLPVALPLLIELPLIWLLTLAWSRHDLLQERRRLLAFAQKVFPQWGEALPSIMPAWRGTPKPLPSQKERNVHGICLATDIESYTHIATQHSAHETWRLLNAYYQVLGQPVRQQGGIIADVTGDSMIAVWLDQTPKTRRMAACLATLNMAEAVDHFNKTSGAEPMITRIGLFEGDMTLGELDTGGSSHFRAIGDTVNTASRIQGVNKQLGTRILASRSIVADLNLLFWRPLGRFRLLGRQEPVDLVEISGLKGEIPVICLKDHRRFCQAVDKLAAGQWQTASEQLEAYLAEHPADGPTLFFLQLATQHLSASVTAWDGIVSLQQK